MGESLANVFVIDHDLPDMSGLHLALHLKAMVETVNPRLSCVGVAIRETWHLVRCRPLTASTICFTNPWPTSKLRRFSGHLCLTAESLLCSGTGRHRGGWRFCTCRESPFGYPCPKFAEGPQMVYHFHIVHSEAAKGLSARLRGDTLDEEDVQREYSLFGIPLDYFVSDHPGINASFVIAQLPEEGLVVSLDTALDSLTVNYLMALFLESLNQATPGLSLVVKVK